MEHEIERIRLTTLTHSLIGGFDTQPVSQLGNFKIYEFPRSLAIKGSIRWWLRVLLAGALWESGIRDENELEERVKETTARIFGSTERASKVRVFVEMRDQIDKWRRSCRKRCGKEIKPIDVDNIIRGFRQEWVAPFLEKRKRRGPPKLRIPNLPARLCLLLRDRCVYLYEPDLSFELVISKRLGTDLTKEEEEVVKAAVRLWCIFGGIGAMTRRGFGAVKCYSEDLRRIYEARDPLEAKEKINSILESALEAAHSLLGTTRAEPDVTVPPFPLLAFPENGTPFRFDVGDVSDGDSMKILTLIGASTLKLIWKAFDKSDPYGSDYDRSKEMVSHDTWILGLPRAGKTRRDDEIPTGYLVNGEKPRRASAIAMKPIDKVGSRWRLLIYGFLSKDWPTNLVWHGSDQCLIKVSPPQAFDKAWTNITKILLGRGGDHANPKP